MDPIHWLNDVYLASSWPFVRGFIEAHALHGIVEGAAAQGLSVNRDKAHLIFEGVPRFEVNSDGTLALRFPNDLGFTKTYKVALEARQGEVGIHVSMGVSLLGTIGKAGATLALDEFDVTKTGINLLGHAVTVIDGFFDLIDPQIRTAVEASLATNLGTFQTLRWDPDGMPAQAAIVPELVSGNPGVLGGSAVDIYLISDGFKASEAAEFEDLCDAMAYEVTAPAYASRPFTNFRSVIRVHRIFLPAQDLSLGSAERVVTSFADPISGSDKSSVSNVGRLGVIGGSLPFVKNPPILAFLSKGTKGRATAHGNLILQPLKKEPNEKAADFMKKMAEVLVHELGHTYLAGLADEYVEEASPNRLYRGGEPAAPNVTREADPAKSKWKKWTEPGAPLQAWDAQVTTLEGGFGFGKGIYRPVDVCRMRKSRGGHTFCPVCREAITVALSTRLDPGYLRLRVERFEPLAVPTQEIDLGSSWPEVHHLLLAYPDHPSRYRLTVTGAALPEPWQVAWKLTRASGEVVERTGKSVLLEVLHGDKLEATVATGCTYAPGFAFTPVQLLAQTVPQTMPTAKPSAPTELAQSVAVGGTVRPLILREERLLTSDLALSAVVGGVEGYQGGPFGDLLCRVEFTITGGGVTHTFVSPLAKPGTRVEVRPGALPKGPYRWSARTLSPAAASDAASLGQVRSHFTVGPPQFRGAAPAPGAPFDLEVSTSTKPELQAQFSMRSVAVTQEPVRFEVELRLVSEAFTGVATLVTEPFAAPSAWPQELAVEGSATAPLGVQPMKWQVRAVSATGHASPWVTGPTIPNPLAWLPKLPDLPVNLPFLPQPTPQPTPQPALPEQPSRSLPEQPEAPGIPRPPRR